MSNDYYDYAIDLIYEDLAVEDKKGLLVDKINEVAREHSLDVDDDRNEIITKIAEERVQESFQ